MPDVSNQNEVAVQSQQKAKSNNSLFWIWSSSLLLLVINIAIFLSHPIYNSSDNQAAGLMNFQAAERVEDHCDLPFMLSSNTIYGSVGYDIVTGNPVEVGVSIDPGFADPIFRMELIAEKIESNFYVPVGYSLEKSEDCPPGTTTEIFTGMESYADYLGQIANVTNGNVGAFGTAFGGSPSSQSAYNAFYNDQERISVTKAYCEVYKITLNTTNIMTMPEPTLEFVKGVDSLRGTYNETAYMYFFYQFGTHLQTSTTFGSAYYYNSAWSDKLDIKKGGSLNAYEGDINESVEDYILSFTEATNSQSSKTKDVLKQSSWEQAVTIGSSPIGLTV